MNREEALEYVSKYVWWPCSTNTGYTVWGAPDEWSWFAENGNWSLVHSVYDPITLIDWQNTRLGVESTPVASTPTAEPDMVNHPPHYQSDNGIECIDAIRAALGREGFIAYCRGNAIKYLWRDKVNNVEDRNKAIWYINRANAEEQSQ